MREALKHFPNDALLLVQLSASLERLDGTDNEKAAYLKESILLQEQILKYADDSEIKGSVLYNICFSYQKNGELQKAIEYANKLPNLYKTCENALIYFLDEKDKIEISRQALEPLAWAIRSHLYVISSAENQEKYKKIAEQISTFLLNLNS